MKYFLDTEFHEFNKQITENIVRANKFVWTIDLISIGIVCEDGREFYAVCNDFDVEAAFADKWLRVNVIKPIYQEFYQSLSTYEKNYHSDGIEFSIKGLRFLLERFGLSKSEIANGVVEFIYGDNKQVDGLTSVETAQKYDTNHPLLTPEFYAYFADYDWVCFCWLFGRMIDLPRNFPMYCRDLKQTLDEKVSAKILTEKLARGHSNFSLEKAKQMPNYPQQENEHNALADAKWNKKLYEFLFNL